MVTAAWLDLDLRELVSELRAVVADFVRLREQLGERAAAVTDVATGEADDVTEPCTSGSPRRGPYWAALERLDVLLDRGS